MGCNRGVEELNLAAMTMIEEAMEDGNPLGGFSLDLVKAFNQMGRPLVQKCMVHLGFPAQVAQTWITSLSHLRRYPTFGKYSPPLQESQKGTHCQFWQCCQCASFFPQRIRSTGATPGCYADNWTFASRTTEQQTNAFAAMLQLTQAFKLPVDFTKSWAWGTTSCMRDIWSSEHMQPPGGQGTIQVVDTAKELGVQYVYTKKSVARKWADRVAQTHVMASRIKHASNSHDVRARLMAGAVWPKVLYGLEITFMGKKYFDQMRREATTAILGEYHQTNPFLACNTISKFMIDPQYYVIEKLLMTIRRWYLRQPVKVLDLLIPSEATKRAAQSQVVHCTCG